MRKKIKGFTLAEVLIALSAVAILAALVLPGVVKDAQNKAMISLLQGTISNLNDVMQSEITNKNAKVLSDTSFGTKEFFEKMDAVQIETTNPESLFASSYTLIGGNTSSVSGSNISAKLKNGVVIGIILGKDNEVARHHIIVDVNGQKGPNILGVDYFYMSVANKTTRSGSIYNASIGDIGCMSWGDNYVNECINSGEKSCYCALLQSGFDPKYLEK